MNRSDEVLDGIRRKRRRNSVSLHTLLAWVRPGFLVNFVRTTTTDLHCSDLRVWQFSTAVQPLRLYGSSASARFSASASRTVLVKSWGVNGFCRKGRAGPPARLGSPVSSA